MPTRKKKDDQKGSKEQREGRDLYVGFSGYRFGNWTRVYAFLTNVVILFSRILDYPKKVETTSYRLVYLLARLTTASSHTKRK